MGTCPGDVSLDRICVLASLSWTGYTILHTSLCLARSKFVLNRVRMTIHSPSNVIYTALRNPRREMFTSLGGSAVKVKSFSGQNNGAYCCGLSFFNFTRSVLDRILKSDTGCCLIRGRHFSFPRFKLSAAPLPPNTSQGLPPGYLLTYGC